MIASVSGDAAVEENIYIFPPSFAQQRLWLLDQLAPGEVAYTIPLAVRLDGHLDHDALQAAVAQVVQRHESLRTTFALHDGQPVQVVAPTCAVPLPLIDLHAVAPAAQPSALQQQLVAAAQQPFDLQHGPLVRLLLLRLAPDQHVLLVTMHHIISDGWSINVFVRDMVAAYATPTGQLLPLPALPIQYPDFALWQRAWLQGDRLQRQLDYWTRQLAGAPALLELPTDFPRPAIQQSRGATHPLQLSPALLAGMQRLSRQQGTTLFMTLLAAFQLLLARYSGQRDIVVGTPIANRTRRETEGLIGFFVNTLVLRTVLTGNPTFVELLGQVRETALGAYAHQDVPFERLVEVVQASRDLRATPLFQVMFVLQNAAPPVEMAGLALTPLNIDTGTAKFDLTLSLEETGDGLAGTIEYNSDLFTAATIGRLAGHFTQLVTQLVANPHQSIWQVPLLPAAERQQLLVAWNATAQPLPSDICLHHLVEQQVLRTPHAMALTYDEQQLTYAQLDQRANQLAHALQQRGVGPDVRVAICLERSLDLVIALLAVLKAGGAYVPLDPAYPQERLSFMLADAQVRVLITRAELCSTLPPVAFDVLSIDDERAALAQQPTDTPTSSVTPDHLAYVMYTSGSTGRPKGVMITHRAISNHMHWMHHQFHLTATDRVLQKTPFSFDASVWEFYAPLIAGAQLVLARPGGHQDPRYLIDTIMDQRISTLQLVPSLLQMLLATPGLAKCTSLERVFCGGEPLPPDLPARLTEQLAAQVFNLYGPTETTIDATWYACAADSAGTSMPIGTPISNTQLYLLDAHGQPVPVGIAGELYIGGLGLGRGYLNRPALTAARFVPNPFATTDAERGSRLYRTGDLARYRQDGAIEFLGRVDQQVKVRGFRIEPGEIEAVLRRHPQVHEAAVLACADQAGDQRLVAYIVPADAAWQAEDVHAFLQARLPQHMVPAILMSLETLPLMPNGKLDRRALPSPEAVNMARAAAQVVAARDTVEFQLVQLWQELLGVQPIGVTDNFFALGGHSLMAVRLLAHIEQQFKQELTLAALFQSPTIEQLACMLRQQSRPTNWSPLVAMQAGGDRQPLFWIHPVGGNVLCYSDLVRQLGPEQPFFGLQAAGLEDGQAPNTTIEAMATCYIAALRAVQPQGPYQLGGWSLGGTIAFEMAHQLERHGESVALLALLDSRPIDATTALGDANEAEIVAAFARDMAAGFGQELPVAFDEPAGSVRQLHYLLAQAKQIGLLPPDTGLDQLRRYLQVYTGNLQALRHYVPQRYGGHITYFRASEQGATDHSDPTDAWRELAQGGIDIYSVPGSHETMLNQPHVQHLAAQLTTVLTAVAEGAG